MVMDMQHDLAILPETVGVVAERQVGNGFYIGGWHG